MSAPANLQRWQEEGPPALASLCRRFRERDLLKATAVTHLTREQQLQALAVAGGWPSNVELMPP